MRIKPAFNVDNLVDLDYNNRNLLKITGLILNKTNFKKVVK